MNYGVLIGKVVDAQEDRNSNHYNPHYHVIVETDNKKQYEIQINVRSKDPSSPDLLYYKDEDFNAEAISILPTLEPGFYKIDYHQNLYPDLAIDYIRGHLFDPHKMKVVGFN